MATFSSDSQALQLTSDERANVLRLLERRSSGSPVPAERRLQRHTYDPALPPLVEITGPTGPALTFVVIGRNLSSGGLAFLHGAPLPIGTPCSVTLFDKEGAPSISPGNIVRCRKVAGRIHELGISFSSKIDVSRFVGDRGQSGARPSIPDSNIQRASVNPTITGLAAAVAKLRTLESEGWPGASVRTVLAEIEMLATLAMKSVPESGNDPRLR